ncbi:metal-dependent hydrolase [Penicillium sp. IBT 35674x]|nr:metal-dependent hydrolase [Penicillium sp. IBT 35674x]
MHGLKEAAEELERAVKGALVNGLGIWMTTMNNFVILMRLNARHSGNCYIVYKCLYTYTRGYRHLINRCYIANTHILHRHHTALNLSALAMCLDIIDKGPVNIILGHCAEALPFIIHHED